MRSSKEIEEFVRLGNPDIKTGEQMDKQTLNDSYAAMEETIASTSKDYITGMSGFFVRNRAAKLLAAAAAIIVVCIGLFMIRSDKVEKVEINIVTKELKSPAEMLTLRSLMIAYRNGGVEAVETQCDNAIEKLGPKSKKITVQELLTEINGV